MLSVALFWFYLSGSFLCAFVASQKGRGAVSWFLLSMVVSPALCLVALAAVPASERSARPVAEADALRSFKPSIR